MRRDERRAMIAASILLGAILILASHPAFSNEVSTSENQHIENTVSKNEHPYVGMWVTEDGYIRHELLPNGRYDEARGKREATALPETTSTMSTIRVSPQTVISSMTFSTTRGWC